MSCRPALPSRYLGQWWKPRGDSISNYRRWRQLKVWRGHFVHVIFQKWQFDNSAVLIPSPRTALVVACQPRSSSNPLTLNTFCSLSTSSNCIGERPPRSISSTFSCSSGCCLNLVVLPVFPPTLELSINRNTKQQKQSRPLSPSRLPIGNRTSATSDLESR